MANESLIGTDAPLSQSEQRDVDLVLEMIIPANTERTLPSAAEVGVVPFIQQWDTDYFDTLKRELQTLNDSSQRELGVTFATADASSRWSVVNLLREQDRGFMRRLAVSAASAYYMDDRVMEALGLEARAPYPKGYEVPSGDLSLLEPVKQRGKYYRDAPE